jgi:hypothetical protein
MSEGLLFEPLDIALRVAAAIESNGGNYFVGGSLASSLQGEPRATNDIDLVIELPLAKIRNFRSSLGADFELDEAMLRDALLHARSANTFYLPTTTKIDFFGRGYDGFDAIEFERRQAIAVKKTGELLFVKTPEDTILRKLLCYRDGGCVLDRHWRDVVSVLRISAKRLDTDYLVKWAGQLCVADLLTQAREGAAG